MRFDIINQRLWASLSSLLVTMVIGVISLQMADFSDLYLLESRSLLGGYITDLQRLYPTLAVVTTALITLSTSLSIGRIVTRFKLTDGECFIQLPIMGILAWSIAISGEYLLSAVVIYSVTLFIRSMFRAVRSKGGLQHLFNATIIIGVLPLLYPAASMLLIILPIALLVIGVTVREWIISLAGLALAPMLLLYVLWLGGGDFWLPAIEFWHSLGRSSGVLEINTLPIFECAIAATALLLSAVSVVLISSFEIVRRTKVRLLIVCILFVAGVASVLIPSATMLSFALLTPALALLTTFALVVFRGFVANIIYLVLVLLLFAAAFFPIFIYF